MRHHSYHPANGLKRSMAYLIDTIPIQLALYLVSLHVFGVSPVYDRFAPPHEIEAAVQARFLIGLGTLSIWIFYCILGELSPLKGTLGKRMMGIRVQSAKGSKLTVGKVLTRNTAKLLSAAPCYLGFLLAFFSKDNRAWHDSLSGTVVCDRH
jgi:uncharacterized RDD family membrane protein YckC